MQDKASKCERHPGQATVASCDACGEGLCLACAVPVRGKVFGPGCLPDGLHADPPPAKPVRNRRMRLPLTGAGFALAAVASLLPWKRYGLGSGAFGAWGLTYRWSILAGAAALLGLAVWSLVGVAHLRPGATWRSALRILAGLVVAGAALHLLHPPGFGPGSFGPWVCLAGGAAALAGTLLGGSKSESAGS